MLLSQNPVQDQSDASTGSPTKQPAHSPVKGIENHGKIDLLSSLYILNEGGIF